MEDDDQKDERVASEVETQLNHCTRCARKFDEQRELESPDYRFWSDDAPAMHAAAPDVFLCRQCLDELDKIVADFAFGEDLVGKIRELSVGFIAACERSDKAVESGAASAFEDNEHDLDSQHLLEEAESLVVERIKERAAKLEVS